MALDQIANFVRGSTDAATDSTQTTISVVDASVFPDPANGEYNLVLWYDNSYPRPDQDPDVEIVRVTARDTTNDDLTVTRGQEGTAGASHPSGSALQLSPTAKMFIDIPENFVSNTGDTVNGDLNVTGTLSESSSQVLTTADEGSGNGLDADTVDGQEASDLGSSQTQNTTISTGREPVNIDETVKDLVNGVGISDSFSQFVGRKVNEIAIYGPDFAGGDGTLLYADGTVQQYSLSSGQTKWINTDSSTTLLYVNASDSGYVQYIVGFNYNEVETHNHSI